MRVRDTLKEKLRNSEGRAATSSVALDLATVYVGLGDRSEALNWVERAVEEHALLLYLGIEPTFRQLANEPRFQAVLKKIGLAASS